MRRSLSVLLLLAAALALSAAAAPVLSAAAAPSTGGRIDVVELSGPLDRTLIAFAEDAIEGSDAALIVLQIDSPAALDARIHDLHETVAVSPVPVAVYVGPAPAVAYGGAGQLLFDGAVTGSAQGVRVGYFLPTVAGGDVEADAVVLEQRTGFVWPDYVSPHLGTQDHEIDIVMPGLIDVVSPSVGQFIAELDGRVVEVGGTQLTLDTTVATQVDGEAAFAFTGEIRFLEPGLWVRTLRVTVNPTAALLFLVMGVALIVLEIYAAGPGLSAGVGVVSLAMASYGIAVLPTNWWAVGLALAGLLLLVVEFQRNGMGLLTLLGTGLLVWGGLTLIDGGKQMPASWWPVTLTALGAALFFGFVLTTLSRSRFSTDTIGREHLVGASGVAQTVLGPDGVVEVNGARWRAVTRRNVHIGPGDEVTVVGVRGIVLAVDTPEEAELPE